MTASKIKFKLIIGLGNPDSKYQNTYHNVGFLFIDFLTKNLQNYQLPITNYQLLKSDVYMNESGPFVKKMLKKSGAKPEELLIIHDDSDIALGNYKLSFNRGAAGHHGIESVIKTLGTKAFWRLRIGIRPISPIGPIGSIKLKRQKAEKFVLKKISEPDKKNLEETFKEIAAGFTT